MGPADTVVDKMTNSDQEKSKIRGTLSFIMYKGSVACDNTKDMVIKKMNNNIYIRVN